MQNSIQSPTLPPPPRLIPDVVRLIAGHLPKADLGRCCSVSRAWWELWSEHLWSHYTKFNLTSFHVLLRIGRFIQDIHLGDAWFMDHNPLLGGILKFCVNLHSLKIMRATVRKQQLREITEGFDVKATGKEDNRRITRRRGRRHLFRDGPIHAFFSNNLKHLELRVGIESCEHVMHCIGFAGRNGRLQNLGTIILRKSANKDPYRRWVGDKEWPLRLSLLVLFLGSLPRLKDFTLGLGDIYGDLLDPVVNSVFAALSSSSSSPSSSPLPQEYIKRPAASEPKNPRRPIALETLTVVEFDSGPTLAKLLRRLPALSSLTMSYLDGPDYLTAVRHFGPRALSWMIDEQVASDLTEDDWIRFFEDDDQKESSFAPVPQSGAHTDDDNAKMTRHGLSLYFGFCNLAGFGNRVAQVIAQSTMMRYRLTALSIYKDPILTHEGAKAIVYNCPNLISLSLGFYVGVSGVFFQDRTPWACYQTLQLLKLACLDMTAFSNDNPLGRGGVGTGLAVDGEETVYGWRTMSNSRAARHHIHQLKRLRVLSLAGKGILPEIFLDTSESGLAERTPKGEGDEVKVEVMKQVWPLLRSCNVEDLERKVTLPEFKAMLTMFPRETDICLWNCTEREIDRWIMQHRPDLEYVTEPVGWC
ncbi:hypothetical protein BGX33_002798 [Mortierella sp. NVP41]|nr:hypothetical protein BGX33_002798 [Mortierella sp. NVP41]